MLKNYALSMVEEIFKIKFCFSCKYPETIFAPWTERIKGAIIADILASNLLIALSQSIYRR